MDPVFQMCLWGPYKYHKNADDMPKVYGEKRGNLFHNRQHLVSYTFEQSAYAA